MKNSIKNDLKNSIFGQRISNALQHIKESLKSVRDAWDTFLVSDVSYEIWWESVEAVFLDSFEFLYFLLSHWGSYVFVKKNVEILVSEYSK